MRCRSDDGFVQAILRLNFAQERLEFSPDEAVALQDDGSPRAVRNHLNAVSLMRDLLANGQLEVWNAESGALLGRTDPYIPINIDLGRTLKDLKAEVAKLEAEEQRRLSGGSTSATPSP